MLFYDLPLKWEYFQTLHEIFYPQFPLPNITLSEEFIISVRKYTSCHFCGEWVILIKAAPYVYKYYKKMAFTIGNTISDQELPYTK